MSSSQNVPQAQALTTGPKTRLRALTLTLLISVALPFLIILLTNTTRELKVQWQQQQPLEVVTLSLSLACLALGVMILLWWLLTLLGYLTLFALKGLKSPPNQSSGALFRLAPKTLKRLLGLSVSASIALSITTPSYAAPGLQDVPANSSATHLQGLGDSVATVASVTGGPQLLFSGANVKTAPELRLGPAPASSELMLHTLEVDQEPGTAPISEVATAQGETVQHVVTPGESLWSIATEQLRSSTNALSDDQVLDYVMEIITLNKETIPEPNVITPGQLITLPNLIPTSN